MVSPTMVAAFVSLDQVNSSPPEKVGVRSQDVYRLIDEASPGNPTQRPVLMGFVIVPVGEIVDMC